MVKENTERPLDYYSARDLFKQFSDSSQQQQSVSVRRSHGRQTKMIANNSVALTNITEHSSCDKSLETAFRALNLIVGFITLTGNLLVFAAIVTTPRLRQNPMNQFLASLAVTDIFMGACVTPGYSLFCIGCLEYPLSKYCWLMEGTKDIALASSIYNLLAISLDRCLAVYWPLRYPNLMTKRKVILILSLVWGLSLAIALIRNFWIHTTTGAEYDAINSRYNNFLLIFVLLIPCITVSVINVKIMLTIRKQALQVMALRQSHAHNAIQADDPDENQAELARKRRGTVACALIVIVFVVSWIPRVSFNIQYAISGDVGEVNALLHKISIFFFIVQSSINPVIYSFFRGDFRQAAVKLLRCKNN